MKTAHACNLPHVLEGIAAVGTISSSPRLHHENLAPCLQGRTHFIALCPTVCGCSHPCTGVRLVLAFVTECAQLLEMS
jgi:hypothetical protein